MDIDELQLITGIPIPVPKLGFTLYQPKIKDIAILGETDYFLALALFRLTKEALHIDNPKATNWLIFNESINQQIEGVENPRFLVTNFLQLFFTQKIVIGPRSLMLHDEEKVINIEPSQFDELQYIIDQIGGGKLLSSTEEQFKPINKRAAEIAAKMQKARKRLAAQQPKAKSKDFLSRYVRTLAVATSNSLEEVNNMTLLQLDTLMQTYLAWESYDLEIKRRLAGGKGEDKLEHWIMKTPGQPDTSIITDETL